MTDSRRALLTGLIDYAGLFPPAGVSMVEAVRNYASYQRRDDGWALARFVVPVSRLPEFEAALDTLTRQERLGTRWPLTALLGAETAEDMRAADEFNRGHLHGGPQIRSVEARVQTARQIHDITGREGPPWEVFCELPLTAELPALVDAVRQAGFRGKIRTGGVRPGDIPAPEAVLAFLVTCGLQRLPFKATAGLHHPLRGTAPLTYEVGSPRATMFGYVNLLLAASAVWHGRPEAQALALLTVEDRRTLHFAGDVVEWAGVTLTAEQIRQTRQEFALAIGSCSFTEPLEEIAPIAGRAGVPGVELGTS
jgi:hypothetical protein